MSNRQQMKQAYCRNVCHSWCCKFLIMKYDSNEPDIKQFFLLRGIEYNETTKELIVPLRCKWLTAYHKCKLYSWRPYSCRAYECDKLKKIDELHYS
jgi:Fe-S-cluster containining protein